MLEPLWELSWKQHRARLLALVRPPCFRAMIWSISKGASSQSWDIPQYSQQAAARCQTWRTSAASTRASAHGAFLGIDLEGPAGFGFEDREQGAGLGVGE